MRIIDIIIIMLIWVYLSGCASQATMIQDMGFEMKMSTDKVNEWYIQTSARADSVKWEATCFKTNRLLGYQVAIPLERITLHPYNVKGAKGYFEPLYNGKYRFTVTVWNDFFSEERYFSRWVHLQNDYFEDFSLDRILRPDVLP